MTTEKQPRENSRLGRVVDRAFPPAHGEVPYDLRREGKNVLDRLLEVMTLQDQFVSPDDVINAEAECKAWIEKVKAFHLR